MCTLNSNYVRGSKVLTVGPRLDITLMPSSRRTRQSTSVPGFQRPCRRPMEPRYHPSSNRSRWPDRPRTGIVKRLAKTFHLPKKRTVMANWSTKKRSWVSVSLPILLSFWFHDVPICSAMSCSVSLPTCTVAKAPTGAPKMPANMLWSFRGDRQQSRERKSNTLKAPKIQQTWLQASHPAFTK